MADRYNLDEIRRFWEEQAVQHGDSPDASWSDTPVIEMEIRELASRLRDGDKVLDIGCANGYTTLHLAALKAIDVLGLDYVPAMIDTARARLEAMKPMLKGSAAFDVGDILSLSQHDSVFDTVIAIRVLINLETWDNQVRAMQECARVTRPGGIVMFSEATLQGWQRLNAFRAEWGMPPIPMPAFNTYLNEEKVRTAVPELECLEVVNFASTYFVGTRVLKPILAHLLGNGDIVNNPATEWNRFFSHLPAAGDYGTQKLFVFRKR